MASSCKCLSYATRLLFPSKKRSLRDPLLFVEASNPRKEGQPRECPREPGFSAFIVCGASLSGDCGSFNMRGLKGALLHTFL